MAAPVGTEPALSRREVLRLAGRLGLGAAGLSLGGTAFAGKAAASSVRETQLETRPVTWELAPGRSIAAMGYKGRIPGPEIRVKEGDRVRVVLTNRLPEPTTIPLARRRRAEPDGRRPGCDAEERPGGPGRAVSVR